MNMNYSVPSQDEFNRMLKTHQQRMRDDENYLIKDRLNFCCVNLGFLDLAGRDLRGVILDRCIFGNDMSGVRFSGAVVVNCCFHDAILQNANFEMAIMNDTSFRNCDLTEANLKRVRGGRIHFDDCDLTGANCEYANFKRSKFDNCDLTNVDMHHADLRKAIFESCEVSGLSLCQADLRKTEFYKTNLLVINDTSPWGNIIITADSMSIGERVGTHEEWFSESIEEVESYQDQMGFQIFVYNDWGRWAPALKLMCEQVRIGIFKSNTEVKKHHACVESKEEPANCH